MRLRARLIGGARLGRTLRRLPAQRRPGLAAAVGAGAAALRDEAVRSLSQPGPSVPGAPPARRSGRLARSVTVERAPDGLAADVGSALDTAHYLELGTRRMAARPWLLPAFLALAPALRRRLLAAGRGGR